ncbi:MAG: hypothetical protein ACR2MO_08230 [Acidimicrobiales bacterium]
MTAVECRAAGLAVSLLALSLLAVGPAQGNEEVCTSTRSQVDEDGVRTVICQASTTENTETTYSPPRPATPVRIRNPTPVLLNVPAIAFVPPVGLCRQRTAETILLAELEAQPYDSLDRFWFRLTSPYPRCPTDQVEAEEVVVSVLERVPLPAPAPHIAPGWAITGKLGYLEPNLPVPVVAGQPTLTDSRTTELGDMALTATAVYRVDWGDAETGPHAALGGPWPNGTITHTWAVTGTYDVVVTAEWTVNWRMGGASGRLVTTTAGTIADFEVTQLQAVRNR